jgi:hypothetical protein
MHVSPDEGRPSTDRYIGVDDGKIRPGVRINIKDEEAEVVGAWFTGFWGDWDLRKGMTVVGTATSKGPIINPTHMNVDWCKCCR